MLLLLVLLALLPPYLMFLGKPTPLRSMETICMVTSQETWLRLHAGEGDAWLMPSWSGYPRVEKPPLLVWLNLLSWIGLSPADATVEALAWRSRIVTVLLVFMALLSTCWAGTILSGRRAGLLAALLTGTFFQVLKQARYATYDTHLMAWSTLAVAAALWAIQPNHRDQENPRTYFWGWLLCGFALGGGILTKGPVALVLVMAPVCFTVAILPCRQKHNLLGLALSVLLGVALAAPWYLYAFVAVDTTGTILRSELGPTDTDQFRPLWYYASLPALIMPWTFWWLLALAHPFRNAQGFHRRELLVPWLWFVVSFVFLSCWPMRNQRYLVPLMPSIGIMTALYMDDAIRRYTTRPPPRWLKNLAGVFWGLLILVSMAAPIYIFAQDRLIDANVINQKEIVGMQSWPTLVLGLVFLGTALAGAHYTLRRRYAAGVVTAAAWMILVVTAGYYGYSQASHQFYEQRDQVERVGRTVNGTELLYFRREPEPDAEEGPPEPSSGFRVYTKRIVFPIAPEELARRARRPGAWHVMAVEDLRQATNLPAMAWTYLDELDDGEFHWYLFRAPAPAAP